MEYTKRFFPVSELRLDESGDEPVIEGHAAVFEKLSEDLGGFREKIAKGAFKKSLNADVRALWNHNSDLVLGRTKAGTLTLKEDKNGLAVRISPPTTTWAADSIESMRRGDVDQMSFGFQTVSDKWEKNNGENIRTLLEVNLFDVSPVTFPAYPQTDVGVRSLFGEGEEAQKILRALQRKRHGLEIDEEDAEALRTFAGEILPELAGDSTWTLGPVTTSESISSPLRFKIVSGGDSSGGMDELREEIGKAFRKIGVLERRLKLIETA